MRYTDRSLSEQMGLHELEISARKKLLGFTEEDVGNLRKVAGIVEDEIDEIVEIFYVQQLDIEEVGLIIGDSDSLKRLKSYQRKYILDLFSGVYNAEYVNSRLRIGLVHKRIGVETKHYISAMAILKGILGQWIEMGHSPAEESKEIVKSLEKLMNFDIQLVFDTYFSTLVSEIESSKKKVEDYAASLEEEVRKRTRELEELSLRDPMTGLYNRRALDQFWQRDIALSRRNKTGMAAIYLDMDGFKQINDKQGHVVGDALLVMVGEILLDQARESDVVCRMGGDEFCIILMQCNEEQAIQFADRIIAAFNDKNTEACSLSIGITEYRDSDDMDMDPFINRADEAMYAAKKISGNAVVLFSSLGQG